ncbi:hypothetical protein FIV00_27960 [Labrenzia sp. THAF82]|uniref:hypothetical protein n=1 Tax=Labrenzia sp. THAF82 TaxID=2587861 RepID=UPI001267AED7|nr:hypothetical protein [Labrenzia sp. THAF82]QFT34362.1 hypothetical protein FIV00_27960 [Labrenzia sp. THAF82]
MDVKAENFKVRFICVLWGDDYIDTFLNIVLPSLLQEGNLPYFVKHFRSIFHFVTDSHGASVLSSSPLLNSLEDLGELVIEVGQMERRHKFDRMSELQNVGIRAASEHGNAIGSIPADAVWAKDSFVEFVDALLIGKRVVASFNFRAIKEKVIEEIEKNFPAEDGVIEIPQEDLADIALSNLHPLIYPHFWKEERSIDFCGHLFNREDSSENRILINTFLPVPYVIVPRNPMKEIPYGPGVRGISNTYHDVFLSMVNPDSEDYYIATNSGAHFNVELSKYFDVEYNEKAPGVREFVLWTEKALNEMHNDFFKVNIFALGKGQGELLETEEYKQFKADVIDARNRSTIALLRGDWRQLFARATYHKFKSSYAPRRDGYISRWLLDYIAAEERPWENDYSNFEDGSYAGFLAQKGAGKEKSKVSPPDLRVRLLTLMT